MTLEDWLELAELMEAMRHKHPPGGKSLRGGLFKKWRERVLGLHMLPHELASMPWILSKEGQQVCAEYRDVIDRERLAPWQVRSSWQKGALEKRKAGSGYKGVPGRKFGQKQNAEECPYCGLTHRQALIEAKIQDERAARDGTAAPLGLAPCVEIDAPLGYTVEDVEATPLHF